MRSTLLIALFIAYIGTASAGIYVITEQRNIPQQGQCSNLDEEMSFEEFVEVMKKESDEFTIFQDEILPGGRAISVRTKKGDLAIFNDNLNLCRDILSAFEESEQIPAKIQDPQIDRYFYNEINAALDNREVDPMLAILLSGALASSIIGDNKAQAARRAVKDIKITDIQNGYATWENRELTAAIVTAEISIINRAEGTYGSICIKYAGIKDDEFEMMRNNLYYYCEDSADKILEWKKNNNFN